MIGSQTIDHRTFSPSSVDDEFDYFERIDVINVQETALRDALDAQKGSQATRP
jgi:hypothetical protein